MQVTRAFGLRAALILLVLIAIVPVFAVVVQASVAEQASRLERAEGNLKALVDLSAANQEQFVEGARQMLAAIASAPPVYEDDPARCSRYFQKLQVQYPVYANFGLLDTQGWLTCRAAPGDTPVRAADRGYFRQALQTGRFTVGEYLLGRASGRPSLAFGMPVYRDDQSVRGVLFVSLDLRRAQEQLRKLTIPRDMTLFVTDTNGSVLASAGPAALPVGERMSYSFLKEAIAARGKRFERAATPEGEWLYAIQPVGRRDEGPLFVAGMMSSADVVAPAARRLYLQLGAISLIALLAAACAWAFGDRIVARPIARLLGRMEALERDELRLDAQGQGRTLRELAELERRFLRMARSLVERSVQRDGAMAEMAGQNNLLESVLQSMAEGVVVLDRRGRLLHMNAAADRILPGIRPLSKEKEPLSAPAQDWGFYQLDGRTPLAPAQRPAARALAGETVEHFRWLARGRLSGGVERIIDSNARPLMAPDGQQSGVLLVFIDATQPHRAEQALRDSEQRFRSLFESNPHPMWVYDIETLRFLTVNDAAVAQYGYAREEFLAMTLADIRPQGDRAGLGQAVREADAMHGPAVYRHLYKNGREVTVEVSSHALDYDGRRARTVLAHDITALLEAQRALHDLNETLERQVGERTRELAISNQELESFSYSVSHDLRAPLQAIDGFGRALMAKHSQQLDGNALHYLERIRENTRHMSGLIDDLLLLAKVTRAEMRTEEIDLAPAAHQIAQTLAARFPEREVAVEIDPALHCRGDLRLLTVALENLLENAWKFTARTVPARIHVGQRAGPDGARVLFVRDNGAGFDMAYVNKLFVAFQRLHTSGDFEGTGIGLATVHRIITRHGGRVWAEGTPGNGATFQFTLGEAPGGTESGVGAQDGQQAIRA